MIVSIIITIWVITGLFKYSLTVFDNTVRIPSDISEDDLLHKIDSWLSVISLICLILSAVLLIFF